MMCLLKTQDRLLIFKAKKYNFNLFNSHRMLMDLTWKKEGFMDK